MYAVAELDAWRERHPELWPERQAAPVDTSLDPDTVVTLGRFAELAEVDRKTVTQYRGKPGWPEPVPDEVYRLRGLLSFWPAQTDLDPDTLVTLDRFAGKVARVAVVHVARCRELRGFPRPVREPYRLGDLLGYWPARPGKRGHARNPGGPETS